MWCKQRLSLTICRAAASVGRCRLRGPSMPPTAERRWASALTQAHTLLLALAETEEEVAAKAEVVAVVVAVRRGFTGIWCRRLERQPAWTIPTGRLECRRPPARQGHEYLGSA